MPGPNLEFSVSSGEIAAASKRLDDIVDAARRASKGQRDLETASKEAATALQKETTAAQGAATAVERAGKAAATAGSETDRMAKARLAAERAARAEADAAARLNKILDEAAKALNAASAASDNLSKKTEQASNAAKKTGDAHKDQAKPVQDAGNAAEQTARQMRILALQMPDVVSGALGGQSAFQLLVQQGGQIYQQFKMTKGGVGGALTNVKNALLGMVTPGRLAAAGLTALAVTGGAALLSLEARAVRAQHAVNGIGARTGVTASGLLEIARANANGLTPGAAEQTALTLAGTGLTGRQIGELTGTTQRYARAFGLDTDQAAKELASAFGDPVKGAEELNRRFGFLSAKIEQEIRLKVEALDKDAAVLQLTKEYRSALDKTTPAIGFFREQIEKASSGVGTMWRGVEEFARRIFRGPTELQRANSLRSERDAILDRYNENPTYFAPALKRVNEINQELLRLSQSFADKAVADQKQREQQLAAERSRQVAGTVDQLVPEGAAARSARARLQQLEKAQGDKGIVEALGLSAGDLPQALARARTALEQALLSPLEKLRQDGAIAERMAAARTFAERTAASAEQARLQTLRATADALQAAQAAENARRAAIAEATREARDTLRTARQRAELVGLNPYDRGLAEIRQRYENLSMRIGGNAPASAAPAAAAPAAPAAGGAAGEIRANRHGLDPQFERLLRALEEAIPGMRRTSGFRDSDHQAELYRKYGPGKAAPPGASNHEFGVAADYVIPGGALDEARKIAATLGLRINNSNGGAVHIEPVNARAIRLGQAQAAPATAGRAAAPAAAPLNVGPGRDALLASGRAIEEQSYRSEQSIKFIRDMNVALREQRDALSLQASMLGRSAEEITAAEYKQRKLNEAYREGGVTLREQLRPAIEKATDEVKRQAEESERLSRVKQGWDDMRSAAAAAGSAFVNALRSGKSGADAMKAALSSLGDKMLQLAQNQLLEILFGKQGQIGGLLGSIFSAVMGGGPMQLAGAKFADGGIMTASGPLPLRKYATGGIANSPQLALYGEGATPEAIIPLPDGRAVPVRMQESQSAPRGGVFSTSISMGGTSVVIKGDANERTIRQFREEMAARDATFMRNLQRNFGNAASRYQSLYGGE